MQRNYQSQDAYMKMRQEVEQKPNENPYDKMTQEDYERYMQMQAMQNNNSKPNQIPPQSEPIDTKPQLPNQNVEVGRVLPIQVLFSSLRMLTVFPSQNPLQIRNME